MTDDELRNLVEATAGKVLARLGFGGPVKHCNAATAFELAYFSGDFGVSMEVNTLDYSVAAFIYDAGIDERFRPAYRDTNGKIQKRYLTEILTTLGFVDQRDLQERNRKLRKFASDFEANARVLCEEEASLLSRWLPILLPLKGSLFGMTKIEGAPANFYL